MPVVETLGGALFGAFLQVLFDRLASGHVLGYFHERKHEEKLLNKLKVKLLSIDAVVDDAEQKQFTNSYVKQWLDEVKNVVFDAEDLLDEIDYEFSKCELEAESQSNASKVHNFNLEIESRMKQVLDDLEFLASQMGYLGLKEASGVGVGSGSGSIVSQKLPSTSLVVENVIYGRDDDIQMVFNWMTSDIGNANQLSIFSIVGMGGVGKTSLAQHIYNDPRLMEAKFDIKAWVCVSDDFDVLMVTRSILEAITKSKDDSGDLEMVHGRLKKNLSGKKFLLVLDDVWNEKQEKWEAVQTPLHYGAQGSKILVTTRNKKVASAMRSNRVHHLEQLQKDHCWQIFAKHAFQDDNPQLNAELEEIGIKIVEKCKGLPLALKTVGSLLHTKSSVSEWQNVLISMIWDLPKEDSEVIPALLLSYHHLPSHLKRCFAYCALFPKDYLFVKQCLIQLWMAENFLQSPQQSKSLEEVGKQYFDDLLSRSFFQQSSRHETCFVMHDLLNDLAKYVCGDICFRLGVDDKPKCIPKTTRHFSFAINHVQYFDGFGSLYDAKRLRTFMPTSAVFNLGYWLCKMSIHEMLSKFKFLHVLSLSCCSGLTEVPDCVGYLKYHRSLDLSCTGIKTLPDSICRLYNLQILKLNYCDILEELPLNLHKLINLRHLEFIDTKVRRVPVQLGELKNLQVLGSFYVGKNSEFSIQQLGELNLHGRLSIGQLQNVENPSDALAACLKNKTKVVELVLEWNWNWNQNQIPDDTRKEEKVLENLKPSKHLEELSIRNYGGTQFPSWFFELSSMVYLRLDSCKYCARLPPLGLLPSLKYLSITGLDGIVDIDADFYGSSSSSFPSLETLHFSCMKEWEEWECKVAADAFPRLQHLSIEQCPKLKGHLPEQLLHLKKLDICYCKQLVANAPRAQKIHELKLQNCGKLQFGYHPTTLKTLTVGGQDMEASLLERIGHVIFDTSLEYLCIYSCPTMNIPTSHCYDFLETLEIRDGCDSLTTFPLDFFPKLQRLHLKCRNLQMISQWHAHNHLKDLNICGYHHSEFKNFISRLTPTIWPERFEELVNLKSRFESFPGKGLSAPCLERLSIERLENLKLLPEDMHILLPSLNELHIKDCPKVEWFPDGGLPSNLKGMDLSNCSKLTASLKGALAANTSLETMSIGDLEVESFPDEGLLPLSLKFLEIRNCLDLKKLDYEGLCHLSSLKKLILRDCPSLQCLPEEGMPKSISTLIISGNCPLLKQRCHKPEGEDWEKIAHIENLMINQ